jgi:hypothetical protein
VSTFWIHRETGTVAVDDAVLKGVDTSSLAKNIQLVWWYGTNGEIRYTDEDRLPVREPVTNLEPFIPIFNNWILAAEKPLPTTSGKTMPAITLAQAKAVKTQLTRGLYYNKFSPGSIDNTAAVNASIQALAQSTNDSLKSLASDVNNFTLSSDGARSADAQALNSALGSQALAHNTNVTAANSHTAALNALTGYYIGPDGGSLPVTTVSSLHSVGTPQMSTMDVGGNIGVPPTVSTPEVGVGDPLAVRRDAHIANINAQTTVAGVAAYDITTGW